MPACAEINSAMQTLSGVTFTTSEQHKETGATRQARDHKDTQTLVSYLTDRSPFLSDPSLRSIAGGRVADDTANVDDAKNIGKNFGWHDRKKKVPEVVIRKKDLAVTLATKLAVRVNDEPIIVDPLVLFQRLLKTAQSTPETIPSLFKYELTNLPCTLFDAGGLPRQASKSTLAEYLWSSQKRRPLCQMKTFISSLMAVHFSTSCRGRGAQLTTSWLRCMQNLLHESTRTQPLCLMGTARNKQPKLPPMSDCMVPQCRYISPVT